MKTTLSLRCIDVGFDLRAHDMATRLKRSEYPGGVTVFAHPKGFVDRNVEIECATIDDAATWLRERGYTVEII